MDEDSSHEIVLLDPQFWGAHALQLAALLKLGVKGPIDDPGGRRPEAFATISDPAYWSLHVDELTDALRDNYEGHSSSIATAAALGAGSSERLTMSVEEVAKALGISRTFAYEAVHRGDIPHIKIGKRMLVPRAALARVLAAAENPDEREGLRRDQ